MPEVLLDGVLAGQRICVAFSGDALSQRLSALGAELVTWPGAPASGEEADTVAAQAASEIGTVDVVLVDAGEAFRGDDSAAPVERLRAAADDGFVVLRAIANAAWIEPQVPGGKIVLLAPAESDGEYAPAVGAALENTARTLSVEWARYGIRVVAIAPRVGVADSALAELVAFIASPAGDYFSGCTLRPGSVA